jgi:nucleotide-binding universal stress UspA family protein
MGYIICATRGGAGSRAAQERAIGFAAENNHDLVFLYVVDTSTLEEADRYMEPAVTSELIWLGRTLLRIAQRRADRANIDSEVVIRQGNVRDEVCRLLEERSAEALFLGAPRGTTSSTFGDDTVEIFAQEIQRSSGVPVEIVRPAEPHTT